MRPDAAYSGDCEIAALGPTVLIVDDHAAFRSAARALLEAAGFAVVGEAGDGASAIAAVEALRPEVVLLDVQLPDLDGFRVAERISSAATIVFTSSRAASTFGRRLAANPGWVFIPKAELSGDALVAAVAR